MSVNMFVGVWPTMKQFVVRLRGLLPYPRPPSLTHLAFSRACSVCSYVCSVCLPAGFADLGQLTCAAGLLSFHSLQALDFFFSFFSVAALVVHLCPMPWDEPLLSTSTKALRTPAAGVVELPASSGSDDGSRHLLPTAPEGNGGIIDDSDADSGDDESIIGDVPSPNLDQHLEEIRFAAGMESRARTTPHRRSRGHIDGRSSWSGSIASASNPLQGGNGSGKLRRSSIGSGGGWVESEKKDAVDDPDKGRAEAGSGGGGSRLASLYVCLIPPLLTAVTDHPTAGANLALVFAMCGGLVVFSWGRLVARDLRHRAPQTARQERGADALDEEIGERSKRIADGSSVAAGVRSANVAAVAIPPLSSEHLVRTTGGGAVAGGSRTPAVMHGTNGGKHGRVPSTSSWADRADEACPVEEGLGDGKGPQAKTTEGEPEPDDTDSMRRVSDSFVRKPPPAGGESGGESRGRGRDEVIGNDPGNAILDADEDVANDDERMPLDALDGASFDSSHLRPRTRSASTTNWRGTISNGSVWRQESSVGMQGRWSTGADGVVDGIGRHIGIRDSGGMTMDDMNDVLSAGSGSTLSRVGRVRAVLRSIKRVTVDRDLLDWRQLAIGGTGFGLGLACFGVQGTSAFAGWYHLWHGAWHMLAMGSTVFLLRARKWGAVAVIKGKSGGSSAEDGSGGGGGSPRAGQAARSTGIGVGWRAWWEASRPGRGGRVETRSYEMVPK